MDKKEFIADKEMKKIFPNASKIVIINEKENQDNAKNNLCRILVLDENDNRIQEIYGNFESDE